MRPATIVLLVLVAAVFGGLMAARDLVDNIWVRALIAAIAAGGCYPLMSLVVRRLR